MSASILQGLFGSGPFQNIAAWRVTSRCDDPARVQRAGTPATNAPSLPIWLVCCEKYLQSRTNQRILAKAKSLDNLLGNATYEDKIFGASRGGVTRLVRFQSVRRGHPRNRPSRTSKSGAENQHQAQRRKTTQGDLAGELRQFDELLAEHKGEKTEPVAQMLLMQAMLYKQVLKDDAKAEELFGKLERDFPDTKTAASLKQQEAGRKVQAALRVGTKFPDFHEQDVAGKPMAVANYQGKVVLVDFWATWCGPCVAELPNVLQVYGEDHAEGGGGGKGGWGEGGGGGRGGRGGEGGGGKGWDGGGGEM